MHILKQLATLDLQLTCKEVHHSFATISDPKVLMMKRVIRESFPLSLKFFFTW